MQKRIATFLKKKNLLTLSVAENNLPWAVSCYYVFDDELFRLIYVTGEQTRHAQIAKKNPNVAGTIFTPTRFVPSLQGVQFLGTTTMLEGEAAEIARALYKTEYRHPMIDSLSVWEISLDFVRLMDHSLGLFGKMEWVRGEEVVDEISVTYD